MTREHATGVRDGLPQDRPAERRQLTVMFCDLVGSTALSEQLDPEELRDLMRAYRSAARTVVEHYDGYVAQVLGDGLLVYFGWPLAHEDDAERCVRAALEIVRAVNAVHAVSPLAVRIGVATGEVVVGGPSRDDGSDELAVGRIPNLASRLQALAAPNQVLVAAPTRSLLGGIFTLEEVHLGPVRGLAEPVRAWQALEVTDAPSRFDASHGGELTPLVGREQEIALLLDRQHLARKGAGQVVLLSGEPGIGKSRVLNELRQRLEAQGVQALRFQCLPYYVNHAFWPSIDHFERALKFARDEAAESRLDKLEALMVREYGLPLTDVRYVASLLSIPCDARYGAVVMTPQKHKDETLRTLMNVAEAATCKRPSVMLFEDVHWADASTLEVLDLIVDRLENIPLLIVLTHRPEFENRWTQRDHVITMDIGRLTRAQSASIVYRLAAKALPDDLTEEILTKTDGVPLFLEELTKSVLESGELEDIGDRYERIGSTRRITVPNTVRDSLMARLDRNKQAKQIAQIGAVIGREFSDQLLLRARGPELSVQEVQNAVDKLKEAGLVYDRSALDDKTYVFKHALVQDAAYESLLKAERLQLHARLARILQEDFPDRVASEPEVLAHHHTKAGNLAAAIPLWCKAGRLAAQRVALREAVAHFQDGLKLIAQLPPSSDRDRLELEIREPLNAVWTGLRGWPSKEVRENAAAILELADRQGTPKALLVGLWGLWVNTTTQGRIADSLEWAERLLSAGRHTDNIDLLIVGHGAAMISHFCLGNLENARDHGDRVLELYEPQHASRWMQVTASDFRTLVGIWSCQWTWMLGYPDQAVRMSEERDKHAREVGHAFNLIFALTLGAYIFDYRREPERLLERIREAERLEREEIVVPFMNQVMIPQVEGLARLRGGQLSDAIAALRRGIDNWNKLGGNSRVPYLKSALAEALALKGDHDAGLAMIEECLEQIERPGWQERSHHAEVLRLKGWMLMRMGRYDHAEAALHASIAWAREQKAKGWELRSTTTLARLWQALGKHKEAYAMLAPLYGWFQEGLDTWDLVEASSLLEELNAGLRARSHHKPVTAPRTLGM